jgi:hypothetical protein
MWVLTGAITVITAVSYGVECDVSLKQVVAMCTSKPRKQTGVLYGWSLLPWFKPGLCCRGCSFCKIATTCILSDKNILYENTNCQACFYCFYYWYYCCWVMWTVSWGWKTRRFYKTVVLTVVKVLSLAGLMFLVFYCCGWSGWDTIGPTLGSSKAWMWIHWRVVYLWVVWH